MTVATGQELCAFLTAGALPAGAAVVVPLRPGRKHVLPTARWGVVTVDDARLPWGVRDAGRLRAALRLRQLGVSQRSLSSSAPPFTLVQSLTPAARQEVLELWPHLAVWRGGTPWMQLVQRVTAGAAA